jgi:hypothetical protein
LKTFPQPTVNYLLLTAMIWNEMKAIHVLQSMFSLATIRSGGVANTTITNTRLFGFKYRQDSTQPSCMYAEINNTF